MTSERTLPWDWHPGKIPDNVIVDETAYIETTYSFGLFRSQQEQALIYKRGSASYKSTMFDMGPRASMVIGEYAMVHGARIICDSRIEIGDYTMISWNVVLMDTYRLPLDTAARRAELRKLPFYEGRRPSAETPARPIRIGSNVWMGFEVCVLPGVSIGEGAIIGARSVVVEDIPPFAIAAGNPARVIRQVPRENEAC